METIGGLIAAGTRGPLFPAGCAGPGVTGEVGLVYTGALPSKTTTSRHWFNLPKRFRHPFTAFSSFYALLVPDIFDNQPAGFGLGHRLHPSGEAAAPDHGQHVMAVFAFGGRGVNLPGVVEAEQGADQVAVPHHAVQRRDQLASRFVGFALADPVQKGQIPGTAV